MSFLDKYLYLFDLWNADLLKPFEDDFFTNAREREAFQMEHKKIKFIEFVKEDGTFISFQFVLGKTIDNKLSVCFELITFIKGGFFQYYNEFYLYRHKEKLKEIGDFLQSKIREIKLLLHTNEGQKVRFAAGIDVFDQYPNSLEEIINQVLKTSEKDYKQLEKKYEKNNL